MNQIDSKIIEAVVRPGGVTAAELEEINPAWRNELEILRQKGMQLYELTINGQVTYSTVEITSEPPAPAPTNAAAPPAEAPRSVPPAAKPIDETPGTPDIDYDARLTVDTFRVKSREGRPPVIEMIPTGPKSAQVATLFSMQKRKKAIVMVYLKIIGESLAEKSEPPEGEQSPSSKQEPQRPRSEISFPHGDINDAGAPAVEAQEGDDGNVVEPQDYSSVQISPKGRANEKKPEAKPKEQLAREIDEQIQRGELSPDKADAMAELGGL